MDKHTIAKLAISIAIVMAVIAVPISSMLKGFTDQVKIEKSENSGLMLDIQKREDQIEQYEQKLKESKSENSKLKDQNKQLESDLQAKRERQEQARIAAAQQAAVPVSTTKPASHPTGCDNYRSLVAQYDWDVNVAMAVMAAESGCNPSAANHGDNHGVCMGSFGLFQISCHSGAVYDPAQNVAIAYGKYKASGWQPWGAFTNGSYLRFL